MKIQYSPVGLTGMLRTWRDGDLCLAAERTSPAELSGICEAAALDRELASVSGTVVRDWRLERARRFDRLQPHESRL